MKKIVTGIISTVLAMIMVFGFVGCFGEDSTPKTYTVQYTDGTGIHKIDVTAGMPYSLEALPEKNGYVFTGLFDAEVGGTQYVSANGASLSTFDDGKNIVLFPQFTAKNYTVILNYQGAEIAGSRQFTVEYGSALPELPKNLSVAHSDFTGWYTKANCAGLQVADKYGLIPAVSVLNETNFDLSGEYVYLYAGFDAEKYTVTFCFGEGVKNEEMQVPYNTPISELVPETRVDGNAVFTWSKTQDGEVFNGKITEETVLYAVEYAPVIEFDSNGGSKVNPIIARAGSNIALPKPTKDLAKFSHWEDLNGNAYTSTSMPSASISLKAVWQAKLVFDSNGGSEVDDISVAAGDRVTLPTPEKEGYIFAGWYTVDKEQYVSTTMPSASVALKAGWYKSKTEKIIVTKDNRNNLSNCACSSTSWSKAFTDGPKADWRKTVDLSQYLTKSGGTIKITLNLDMRNKYSASVFQGGIYLYDGAEVSNANYLDKFVHKITKNSWETFTDNATLKIRSDTLYLCYYASTSAGSEEWDCLYFTNMWIDLEYPDTTSLYL